MEAEETVAGGEAEEVAQCQGLVWPLNHAGEEGERGAYEAQRYKVKQMN
jgi:hypothetical protein